MIVITDVKFMEFDRDEMILAFRDPYRGIDVRTHEGYETCSAMELQELVRGRRYVRPDGQELVIGVSKQAQDVIGIQYEAFDTLRKESDRYFTEIISMQEEMRKVRSASFWVRLKWIFTGVKKLKDK